MDAEWKGSYASTAHEISPVLKEVILIICLVSKNLVQCLQCPAVPLLLTFWLACGLFLFQAGGDSCGNTMVYVVLCSVWHNV